MKLSHSLIAMLALSLSATASAQDFSDVQSTYEVTITNITRAQLFTPILVTTHSGRISLFQLGAEPSQAIADLAEGGVTDTLQAVLADSTEAFDVQVSTDGLLGPGESTTVTVQSSGQRFNRLSLAGMLLPTNDTFVAINSMRLPRWGSATEARAYDAGSEENDELCMNIPGPQCEGAALSEGIAEGFVYVSSGIQGNADLSAEVYDWHDPVARVRVVRVQ